MPSDSVASPSISCDVLPHFTGENVSHWIKLCEYAFKTYNVTDVNHKVYLLFRALPSDMQLELGSLLDSNDDDKFSKLKERLVKLTAIPTQRRLEKLLGEAELGDRKPSAFLRHLRELAGTDECDAKLLRSIFLSRLPRNISQILAPMSGESLDAIAESADKIYEFMPQHSYNSNSRNYASTISDVSQLPFGISTLQETSRSFASCTKSIVDAISGLQNQISNMQTTLTTNITNLQASVNSLQSSLNNRNRSFGRSSDRNKYAAKQTRDSQLCYYHNKFRDAATKCNMPCSWQGN